MLNSSEESGHLCLVPDLSDKAFCFSVLRMMLAVNVSYVVFIVLGHDIFIPDVSRAFITSDVELYQVLSLLI